MKLRLTLLESEYSDEIAVALLLELTFCFYFEGSDRKDRIPQQSLGSCPEWSGIQFGLASGSLKSETLKTLKWEPLQTDIVETKWEVRGTARTRSETAVGDPLQYLCQSPKAQHYLVMLCKVIIKL